MQGYWDEPAATAEIVDEDGWLHTGDLAVMRTDERLNIVGRSRRVVIRGGENLYPLEVERIALEDPDVVEAHCVGVPDQLYGEELALWVRLRPGVPFDASGLRERCRNRLSRFKVPRHVLELRGADGAVDLQRLRAEAIATIGLEPAAARRTV
jgi:fatty-acyl-CoA synthase